MKAAVYHGPRDIRVEDVPDATIREPTDALVRVTHACICGSDLWPYRGDLEIYGRPGRTGHEFMGVVEAVGPEVRTIRKGQRVIAPFAYSDGTCDRCRAQLQTSCRTGGYWGGLDDGGQGEAVRCPLADGTLVPLPDDADLSDPRLAAALATLTDVMGTGHHGALAAGVSEGVTVAVVGDGAVGLCAVLAARRLGAERIIALGHHEHRLGLARSFGATDIVTERGDAAVARLRDLTSGGVEHVIEAVGTAGSFATAIGCAVPGGTVGHVGVPAEPVNLLDVHGRNVSLIGGVAPVRAYIPDLLTDILAGDLDPSPVLDLRLPLDGVPEGYAAMDERRALKVLVEVAPA